MKKLLYIGKRLIQMVFILLIVSFVLFMLLRFAGSDPLNVIIGDKQNISEEARQALREQYNLDKPLLVQYGIWLSGAVQGDFGTDYVQKSSVSALIAGRTAVTVGLVALGMALSVVISIPLGIFSALKKNTGVDYAISTLMLIMTSVPGFLLAMILLYLLSSFVPGYQSTGSYANFAELIGRLWAPSICLAFGNVALIGRITRNAMVEQLNADYIMTCRAKGLGKRKIILRHAFKNSVIPVFTSTSMLVGTMIGASVLVEQIFSLPGLGSMLCTAILKDNYPVIMALTLLILLIFQVVTLISDIMYTVLDPRIKI